MRKNSMSWTLCLAICSVLMLSMGQVKAENNHLPVGSDRTEKFTTPPGDVTGTVTDVRNAPLAGATVTIKGTRTSTVTDQNGRFTLKNVPDNAVLQISFSGYLTEEVSAKSAAKVSMRET